MLYLRGRDYQRRPDNQLQDLQTAANFYEEAIKLDPKFALAHARLSATASLLYHWYEPIEKWKQKADAEARESQRLQPNLPEGHLALGLYQYYIEGNYDEALRRAGNGIHCGVIRGFKKSSRALSRKQFTNEVGRAVPGRRGNLAPTGVADLPCFDERGSHRKRAHLLRDVQTLKQRRNAVSLSVNRRKECAFF